MEQLETLERINKSKFLVANIKKDKGAMLSDDYFKTFSIISLGGDKIETIYYDTKDYFFRDKGISIYFTSGKNSAPEFIVNYDSSIVTRIEFLKNMPSFYKISTKDSHPRNHKECINEAVYNFFPNGLGTDIDEQIAALVPVLRVNKVIDKYRIINNTGVKAKMSFCNVVASNLVVGGKGKYDTLEINSDPNVDIGVYNDFEKSMLLQFPTLIKMSSNEFVSASDHIKG